MINKVKDLAKFLETIDADSIKNFVNNENKFDKIISKNIQKGLINTLVTLKEASRFQNEFEKHIYIVGKVLKDITDIWGADIYLSLSKDPMEKQKGLKGLGSDYYYFVREYKALFGLGKLFFETEHFKKSMNSAQTLELSTYIQDLGLIYIKFAQSIGSVVIPGLKYNSKNANDSKTAAEFQQTIAHLEKLQDGLPPISPEYAREVLTSELNAQDSTKKKDYIKLLLKYIDFTKPLKSGSVATTYKITLPNQGLLGLSNEEVVVKIVRGNLEEEIKHGEKTIKTVLTLASTFFPSFMQWIPRILISSFESLNNSFRDEINLKKEAKSLRHFKLMLSMTDIKIPNLIYSSEKFIVIRAIPNAESVDDYIETRMTPKYLEFLSQYDNKMGNLPKDAKKQDIEKTLLELGESHGVELSQMSNFKLIYERVLEAAIYQIIPLGYVHADLHPRNILVGSDNRGKAFEPYFIDFGNTVNIKGLLADPFFLSVYIFLGNSEEIAKRLYNLQDHSVAEVSQKEIGELVKKVLIENGFDGKGKSIFGYISDTLKSLKSGSQEAKAGQNIDSLIEASAESSEMKLLKVSSEIILRLMQETKYTVSGRYLQFIRTILPLGTSITSLAKTLPNRIILKSTIKSAFKGLVLGYFKSLIMKYPTQLANWYQNIKFESEQKSKEIEKSKLTEIKKENKSDLFTLNSFSKLQCSKLFAEKGGL